MSDERIVRHTDRLLSKPSLKLLKQGGKLKENVASLIFMLCQTRCGFLG